MGAAERLLADLRASGAILTVEARGLVVGAPAGVLTPARRAALGANRDALLALLASEAPANPAVSAVAPPRLAPLDATIARDEARKRTRSEIAARVERLAAVAARPDATALDRALAAGWQTILRVKDAMGS